MKKQLKSLLLVAVFACTTLPAWSQASTEGKDFWVANTIICQPPTASSPAYPTIAVSAQKACTVTITDYAGNQLATANVAAGSWTRFGDNTAAVDPAEYALAPAKWYPTTDNVNATDVYKHADKINNYGLHITATENISVYVIMRTPQYSMDASNALPITALQSEYYLQDFYPDANGVDKPVTMTTILATENNTKVDITPKGNTYGKTNNGTTYTVTLNQGQTYYLISEVNSQLAGTHIVAQGDKKIAVYVGSPVTRLPGGVAARDGLFEQMMPTVYWGTQFIATRSMQKDGNIIGITATQNGTEIKMDGYTQTYINEGETYYILLQSASDPYSAKQSNITCHIDQIVTADAAYIETSCPCALISYDTGNSFAGKTNSEIVNGQGDPSSVWISPIQQKINRITFGACYTKKTQAHFLNVVTETATCNNTSLTAYMGTTGADWSDKLSWTPVPGNPAYSYARVQIGNSTENINVFTLENNRGFIAHVYGNGEDESYAYSAGSAAVEQGIKVEDIVFVDGTRSDEKFCMGKSNKVELEFDAKVGTDEVTRVDWDFGDGVSEPHGTPQTKHTYYSPGWYDVTASLYGHQVCADESEILLGTVRFTFRVIRPYIKYVPNQICQEPGSPAKPNDTADVDLNQCKDTIEIPFNYYTNKTTYEFSGTYADSVFFAGQWIKTDGPVTETLYGANAAGCDSIVTCNIHIITSLDFKVDAAAATICSSEEVELPYTYNKGTIDKAWFEDLSDNKKTYTVPRNNLPATAPSTGTFTLPTTTLEPGYHQLVLHISDSCVTGGQITGVPAEYTYPIDLAVFYPSSIFTYQFNNVLAVWKKGYGGNVNPGWDFVAYQWYRNDELIPGATESIYHATEPFTMYDRYYVELTRRDGHVLRSCDKLIEHVEEYTPPIEEEENGEQNGDQGNDQPANAPAKVIRNQQMLILHDGVEFNMFGQRVR